MTIYSVFFSIFAHPPSPPFRHDRRPRVEGDPAGLGRDDDGGGRGRDGGRDRRGRIRRRRLRGVQSRHDGLKQSQEHRRPPTHNRAHGQPHHHHHHRLYLSPNPFLGDALCLKNNWGIQHLVPCPGRFDSFWKTCWKKNWKDLSTTYLNSLKIYLRSNWNMVWATITRDGQNKFILPSSWWGDGWQWRAVMIELVFGTLPICLLFYFFREPKKNEYWSIRKWVVQRTRKK